MEYTHEQKMNQLFQKVAEVLAEHATARIPETGSFRKVAVDAHIGEENWESTLGIEESYLSETERRVSLGVHTADDDRLVCNYLFKGTKQEILTWLNSPEGLAQIIESCDHLIEKAKSSG